LIGVLATAVDSVRVNVVVGRPIGPAIFDDYCNRIGRKSTLIATLMLMRIAALPHRLRPKPCVGWHPG
jgi:hypothetical protein